MKGKPFLLLIFIIMGLVFESWSQEFEIRSFEADLSDMAARRYPMRTVNDEAAALIKVVTNIDGMLFDTNQGVVGVDRREAEYWVYVAPRERRIRLMAPGYLAKDVSLPEPAQSNTVYQMVVVTKGIVTTTTDLVQVTFIMNEDNVSIQTNNRAAVLSSSRISRHSLPRGEYSFRFIKTGFEEVEVSLNVQEDQNVNIELVPGATTTDIALPGFIIIDSEPSGAGVYLNEQRVGTTPYQGRQPSGVFNLMISHPLYYEHTDQFVLEEGATVNFPLVALEPRFGYYSVNTTPPGAEVILNNRTIGTSPLTNLEIESGNHELQIRHPLYHDHSESFVIEDGDSKTFDIVMQAAYGQLVINSDPEGADVYIDGRMVGTTPYENLQKPSGRYMVRLSKDLYLDASDQFTIRDGEQSERLIPLARNYGTLNLTAEDADIYLNGELVGTDNWVGNVTAGTHQVRAARDQHADDDRSVFVIIGETTEVTLSPRPRRGALTIQSMPFDTRGAQIYINGVLRQESTPASLALLVGTYDVRISKEGYLDTSKQIEIQEGREEELVFQMQTFEGSLLQQASRHRRSKMRYGAATLAVAATGAYFQYSAMTLSDNYLTATTDAGDIYNRMEQHELISYIAWGVSVPLGVMAIVKAVQQKSMERQISLSVSPVKNGAVVGLAIGF